MSRTLHNRIVKLERAALMMQGDRYVVSGIPLPDDPVEQALVVDHAIRGGEVVRRDTALLPTRQMTPDEWAAKYCDRGL